jgi:rod shape-determining protein MreD
MQLYIALPMLVVLAILQSVWLSDVDVLGAQPDLVLLVVIVWSSLRGAGEGALWGFVAGLILDLFSGGPLGGHALALVGVATLSGQAVGQGLGSEVVRVTLLAIPSVLVYHVLLLVMLAWIGFPVDWDYGLIQVALPSVALNALLSIVARPPLIWLDRQTADEGGMV